MAGPAKVSSSAISVPAAASAKVQMVPRAYSATSRDVIEASNNSATVTTEREDVQSRSRQQGESQRRRPPRHLSLDFTPFLLRAPIAYQANEYREGRGGFPQMLPDRMMGVRVYEFNMRVIAGNSNMAGISINERL